MRFLVFLLALLSGPLILSAQTSSIEFNTVEKKGSLPPGVKISTEGFPLLSGGELKLYDPGWRSLEIPVRKQIVRRTGDTEKVMQLISDSPLWHQSVTVKNHLPLELEWDYTVKPNANGKYLQLHLFLEPGMLSGGSSGRPTRNAGNLTCSGSIADYEISFRADGGQTYFADLRKEGWCRKYLLQAHLPYDPAKGASGKVFLTIRTLPRRDLFHPVRLAEYGNQGLVDEFDNDGKGGWTDQGSNDLRRFKPGLIFSKGVPFDVGDRVVVLNSRMRPRFPEKSPEIPLHGRTAGMLHFCHTTAWGEPNGTRIFDYVIRYEDGSEAVVPVRSGVDVLDWWGIRKKPENAAIAWKCFNGSADVGLYHFRWRNPHPDRKLKSVQIVSRRTKTIPVVLGITLQSPGILDRDGEKMLDEAFFEKTVSEEPEINISTWYPCPLDWNGKIVPGSALDLSALNHKPAGKFGFLKVGKNGTFEFEKNPGHPVRFWGTNVATEGPFPEKKYAPGIARTLAAQGVNLVRFHFAGTDGVGAKGFLNPDGTLNHPWMDRLWFFLAELKKNGIYTYVDWNSGNIPWKFLGGGKKIASAVPGGITLKKASLFSPALIEGTRKMAEIVFTAKNPYTGCSLLDDPAVALFEVTNENTLTMSQFDEPFRKDDPYFLELQTLWMDWQKKNQVRNPVPLQGLPNLSMGKNGRRFFAELQKTHYDRMRAFLRKLGAKAPVCGTNWAYNNPADPWSNRDMDYLNDHGYYSWAPGEGKLGAPNAPSVVKSNILSMPFFNRFPQSRIAGKPYCVSEWNFCYPGRYRSEGLPMMAAYSSLHGWDSLLFYCGAGSFCYGRWELFEKNPRILTHTQLFDPSTWGFSQAASAAFRRGDFARAKNKAVITYTPEDVFEHRRFLENYPFLTGMTEVVTEFLKPGEVRRWPLNGASREEVFQEAKKRFRLKRADEKALFSDTGEIRRFAEPGLFVADSPNSQMAAGDLSSMRSAERSLTDVRIDSPVRFASVAFTSLDGNPLKKSDRILMTFAGDSRNKTADIRGNIHNDWGSAPVVTEDVTGRFSLKVVPGKKLHVFALDSMTGRRLRELPVLRSGDTESFEVKKDTHSLYFEIIRS